LSFVLCFSWCSITPLFLHWILTNYPPREHKWEGGFLQQTALTPLFHPLPNFHLAVIPHPIHQPQQHRYTHVPRLTPHPLSLPFHREREGEAQTKRQTQIQIHARSLWQRAFVRFYYSSSSSASSSGCVSHQKVWHKRAGFELLWPIELPCIQRFFSLSFSLCLTWIFVQYLSLSLNPSLHNFILSLSARECTEEKKTPKLNQKKEESGMRLFVQGNLRCTHWERQNQVEKEGACRSFACIL